MGRYFRRGRGEDGEGEEAPALPPRELGVVPVNWAGATLILLAFVFLVVDLKVANHGVPTVGAIVALVLGGLALSGAMDPSPWASLLIVAAVAVLAAGTLLAVLSGVRAARGVPARTGKEGMIGEEGVVREPIGPDSPGWVFVRGELWRAVAASPPEDAYGRARDRVVGVGRMVRVVGFSDGKVAVVPLELGTSGHPPEES